MMNMQSVSATGFYRGYGDQVSAQNILARLRLVTQFLIVTLLIEIKSYDFIQPVYPWK